MRIKTSDDRSAFTIIELLVVVAIIAVLAALTTGVAMRFYSVQQQKNSEVTVTKLYEQLKNEWDTVVRLANAEPISPQAQALANFALTGNLTTVPTSSMGNDAVARVIHVKLRLKQEFPMDFTEILSPYATSSGPSGGPTVYGWDLPPLPVYQKAVADMINAGSVPWYTPSPTYQTPPSGLENSTCLYLALLRSRSGNPYNFDNLGSNALASDSTGLQKWIVDGWRTPITYYRWAFSNNELDQLNPAGPMNPTGPNTTQAVFRDPQDPTGALFSPSWWGPNHSYPIWSPFEKQCHSLFSYTGPNTPPAGSPIPFVGPYPWTSPPVPQGVWTGPPPPPLTYYVWGYEYYMVPVVASAGPNKSYGISFPSLNNPAPGVLFSFPNPMKPDPTGDDADNIYSFRLKLGASGN
jgi:prepilin-type N-terminal cleavage/methylation domain-containing protein